MKKLILKLRKNKANGQINASFSKKSLDFDTRKMLEKSRRAFIRLEGFEE